MQYITEIEDFLITLLWSSCAQIIVILIPIIGNMFKFINKLIDEDIFSKIIDNVIESIKKTLFLVPILVYCMKNGDASETGIFIIVAILFYILIISELLIKTCRTLEGLNNKYCKCICTIIIMSISITFLLSYIFISNKLI